MSASAVALLRRSLPHAELTYLVGPWSEEAARYGPAVDRLETLEFPGFSRRAKANALEPYRTLALAARRLRAQAFDLAVVLRADHWWGALLALSAGVPLRVGSRTPETAALLTHARPPQTREHWGEQALAVARLALEAVGRAPAADYDQNQFVVSETARAEADALWSQAGLDDKRVVALHPSAGSPLKSWPVTSWARLADGLTEMHLRVVLMGAPNDTSLLQAISERIAKPTTMLCGQSLSVSAAVYERCGLVISVDSGAGHLAGAVGTPTVRLYGPAPNDVFGPWPVRADQRVLITDALSCAPCGHLQQPPCGATALPACMLALDVDVVLKAARESLNQG